MQDEITRLLRVRFPALQTVRPISGGSLFYAFRVVIAGQPYFVKYHPRARPEALQIEARGLEALGGTGAVAVPAVEAVDSHWIMLEWIEAGPGSLRETAAERLGHQLAQVHRQAVTAFQLPWGNAIGCASPPGRPYTHPGQFYVEERLAPLVGALERGHWAAAAPLAAVRRQFDTIARRLEPAEPSLLHGDLWAGNWMWTDDGTPVLIDPSPYWGDRSAELAFSEMFGGFPPAFYHAYARAFPLPDDYPVRRPIYQLYHWLVHLYLFGSGYLGPVRSTVQAIERL